MPNLSTSFLKTRWPLLLVLLVFVCCKISQLHYPFYVDEAWVYAPAVKAMASHGPSLMPGSISPELSRGHPLMFHFLGALWIDLFGSSHLSMHSFPLFLSILFLIVLFECCMQLFGHREAVVALLLVSTRVIFFVNSSFVYPEIMLALFAFLSLYCYSRDYFLLTAIMLFMLFFTKEGGLLFGAVIGIDAFVSLFRKNESIGRRLTRSAAVLVPVCLIGLFFVLQKATLGWYILTEHANMIQPNWNSYYLMFKTGLYWTFRGDHAMYVLVCFIIMLSVIPTVKFKNIRYLFLIPPAIVVYAQAQMTATGVQGSVVWMAFFILLFTIPVHYLLQLRRTLNASAQKFIMLMSICVVIFVLYSSLTQIAYRYMIVCIVFTMVFLAVCITTFIATEIKPVFYMAICGILLIGAYGFYSNDRAEDTQLGAFGTMNIELHEFSYLEKEHAYDKDIAFACTWELLRLTDTTQGFLSSSRTFTHLHRFPVTPATEYAMFGNCCDCDPGDYQRMIKDTSFHRVFAMKDRRMWVEIYKRNR